MDLPLVSNAIEKAISVDASKMAAGVIVKSV